MCLLRAYVRPKCLCNVMLCARYAYAMCPVMCYSPMCYTMCYIMCYTMCYTVCYKVCYLMCLFYFQPITTVDIALRQQAMCVIVYTLNVMYDLSMEHAVQVST